MKILINGSSVSSGAPDWHNDAATGRIIASQITWPYCLKEKIDFEMTNLAVAGAGNTYIHDSTIEELSLRSYDLVLIMWADYTRIDYKVRNPRAFASLHYTSMVQRNPSHVPEEMQKGFEFIPNNWIFSCEYQSGNTDPELGKLFGFDKFTNPKLQLNNTLLKIISLQGVLKSMNIPYRFMFYREYPNLKAFDNLIKMIDWNNVMPAPYLHPYAQDIGEWDAPRTHPTPAAFNAYADIVAKYLKNQKLI